MEVFSALGTQWLVGVNGATGINYEVLPVVFRLKGMPRKDWPELFDAIQVMEDAALQAMSQKG